MQPNVLNDFRFDLGEAAVSVAKVILLGFILVISLIFLLSLVLA